MKESAFVSEFQIEASELLIKAEEDILLLEKKDHQDSFDEKVNSLFRCIHTIKGISGFLKKEKLMRLSHVFENVVDLMRKRKVNCSSEISDVLLKGVDKLKQLICNIENYSNIEIDSEVSKFEEISSLSFEKKKDAFVNEVSNADFPQVYDLSEYDISYAIEKKLYVYECTIDLIEECKVKRKNPDDLVSKLRKVGDLWDITPDPTKLKSFKKDSKKRCVCSFLLATIIDEADILISGFDFSPLNIIQYSPSQLSDYVKGSSLPDTGKPVQTTERSLSPVQTVRISLPILDKLMNLATELVLIRNQNLLALESNDMHQLTSIYQKLNVITSDIQSTIMKTRMRPIGNIFKRFNRIVHDLGRQLGKELLLEIDGADIELDKNILEAIADPMTHLLRNAVDHGIEPLHIRMQKGKPSTGLIRLNAFQEAGLVHIRIFDDGKGIDPKEIKEVAIKKGIISVEQAEKMSNSEAFNLIFEPGFSTAKTVSEISGRGVGMDVVKLGFQKLGGTIDVSSIVDKGTTITIKLPLTLAIIPALIVTVEENYFVIPQVNVLEMVWLYGEATYNSIKCIDGKEVIWIRGKLLPLIRLSEMFEIPKTFKDPITKEKKIDRRVQMTDRRQKTLNPESDRRTSVRERRVSFLNNLYIVVLKIGNENVGLIVDQIIDTEEIVVKPLHDHLKCSSVFSGTTILGDGGVALILELQNLLQLASYQSVNTADSVSKGGSIADEQHLVLLFDIGKEERFAMPLCLVKRVQEIRCTEILKANQKSYLKFSDSLIPLVYLEHIFTNIDAAYDNEIVFVIIPKAPRNFGIVVSNILDMVEIPLSVDFKTIDQPGILGTRLIGSKLSIFLDPPQISKRFDPNWLKHNEKYAKIDEKRILLVDDSDFFRRAIASHIRETGAIVSVASHGQKAWEILKEQTFDCIISDIKMPVMNGLDLAKLIRSQDNLKALPLLAISETDDQVLVSDALSYGFDGVKLKYNIEEILESIITFFKNGSGKIFHDGS